MTVVVRAPRPSPLPLGMMPRGLSRAQAAFYVGVSATLFEKLVIEGSMPKPVRLRGRVLWDARKLDAAFDALDTEDEPATPWERQRA
ncbi:MAG: helix-turn-helix transcriptional regulator [Solimonas sp.]